MVHSKFLSKLAERKDSLTEHDIVTIFSQIPWEKISQVSVDLVMSEVLLPIQNLLEKLTEMRYLQALSILTKILLVIDEKFPEVLKLVLTLVSFSYPHPSLS